MAVRPLSVTVLVWACLLASPAWALDAVTEAMQAAYPAYRAALFRTNTKSQAESEQALSQARAGWQAVIERFGGKPQPPYDRDPAFSRTLSQVAAVYEKADAQVRAQHLAEAHETLEEARDLMAELRRRNGVVVYSDHMNAYHAQMEHLLGEGPKQLAAAQGFMLVMAQLGTLEYLARELRNQALPSMTSDAEFPALLNAVEGSLARLRSALLAQDGPAASKAIGQLKGPYSRLFMRFG